MLVHWQFHLCVTQSLWLDVADRLSVSKRLSWNLILQFIISWCRQVKLLSLKFHSKGCPRSARGAYFTLLFYYPQQGPLVNLNTTFVKSYGLTHSLNHNKCLMNFGSVELPHEKMLFNRLSPQTLYEVYWQTSLLIWYSGDESHFISKSFITSATRSASHLMAFARGGKWTDGTQQRSVDAMIISALLWYYW